MNPRFFLLIAGIAGWIGCGPSDVWVDTTSGTCLESQIEEMRATPDVYAEVGTRTCSEAGLKGFAGEFRCRGSEEEGTRRMQARCGR